MINANEIVGSHDILFVTIDSLRYDVAASTLAEGKTPNISAELSEGRWELRHTPGNFTYAAHQAFFAGFLPTPAEPGQHARLFAAAFPGSETTTESTCVFEEADMVTGLRNRGYHSICIGGVGFFAMTSKLGQQLPALFDESHWTAELGVTSRDSTAQQVDLAISRVNRLGTTQRLFLFVNVSATHQPNCIYVDGADEDSVDTQAAAMAYVDQHMGRLFESMRGRSPKTLVILTSDHGTAYGEDGYWGHRISHPTVWQVPYAEFII